MIHRLPIIGVMGSGQPLSEAHAERAAAVGRWIARRGYHLLTGGGGGAMAAVSQAFCQTPDRRGLSIGVTPSTEDDPATPPPGYPNPWIEVPIRTHLPLSGARGTDPLSRNHINILTATAIIALPGGAGTLSEIQLALRYDRPVVAYLESRDETPDLPQEVDMKSKLEDIADFVEGVLRSVS
ncbi:MAG: SLOG cluster 4 domain-containing protein [Planctomycetota bacterium]|jgi:uncharacterized protein (TIGR00725 family)